MTSRRRTDVYILVTDEVFKSLEERGSPLLPRNGAPGVWFGPGSEHSISVEGVAGLPLIPLHNLWDYWDATVSVLFRVSPRGDLVEDGGLLIASEARLARRIPTWNTVTFTKFACDEVERSLWYYRRWDRDDNRPARALAARRRFLSGEGSQEDLAAARGGALEAAQELDGPLEEGSTRSDWDRLGARDVALAAVALSTVMDSESASRGRAREATQRAFQAGCRNGAGWLAAKVRGPEQQARFLAALGLGTRKVRGRIADGKLVTQGARPGYVQDLSSGEILDLSRKAN